MPPKKKPRRKSTPLPKEPDEPLEYVNHVREKSGKRFATSGNKTNVNYDIEQNIREIRALLQINSEIFGRCMKSVDEENLGLGEESETFKRYSFDVVKVRQNPAMSHTQFITEYEHSEKVFVMKPLFDLPAGLDDVFVVKYQDGSFSRFVDYKAFFESAIMLHDDILEPFLAKLKGHIETIHVCLGKIETWLLEPNNNIEFLKKTFGGKKLKIPTAKDFGIICGCPAGRHVNSDLCLGCNQQFGHHVTYCGYCDRSYNQQRFKCKKFQILKTCDESGKFEKQFDIANQSDQTKLQKFLDFMDS